MRLRPLSELAKHLSLGLVHQDVELSVACHGLSM